MASAWRIRVKINRQSAAVLGLAAAGALLLAACGSDNNGGGGASGSAAASANTSNIQCSSGSLTGGGSTAQTNAITAWYKAYENKCAGANINYQTVGSGAGVTGFENGTLDWAGSDFALSGSDVAKANARCTGGQAIDLPMAPGGIAVGYNVPGVSSLNLSASTLAQIFSGKITNWNDPAIAKDNPGAKLPNLGIQTFHRSDSSGTSYNFTNYLTNEAKADWPAGTNKNWPVSTGQGDKGSSLMAGDVKKTAGGIGYFEDSFATQNNLPVAKVGNAAGKFVELTSQNVTSFLSTAKVTGAGNDLALSFDYTNSDANAYPNLLVTYEIVCTKGNKAAVAPLLKNFLAFSASSDGQAILQQEGYVPLPSALQTKVAAAVATIS
jgi:phosphate transport system substrate-binding protein